MRSWIRAPSNNADDHHHQQPHTAATVGRRASSDSLSSYASSFREPRYSFAASDSESDEDDVSVREENNSSSDHKSSSASTSNKPVRRRRVASGATAVSSSVLIRTVVHPVLNILGTAAMIGCLLWYYNDHQLWDITASIGIDASTAVALVITLLTVLLRSGIEYGISEYKWTRFQFQSVKLIFLDVYHSSARGMGGILRVLFVLRRFDWVVIVATIFYLGLIAVAPSAQHLLQQKPVENNMTCRPLEPGRPEIHIRATNISLDSRDGFGVSNEGVTTYLRYSFNPLTVNGTLDQGVAVPFGIKDFLRGTQFPAFYPPCPSDIDLCVFPNFHIAHTTLDCQSGSLDTEIINVHTDARLPLREYYGLAPDADHLNVRTPSFYFAGNMFNRTLYNLGNVSASDLSLELTPVPFNQTIRDRIGEQTFVMVTYQDTIQNLEAEGGFSVNDLHVHQCTLHTAANVTTINVSSHDQSYFFDVHETRPINIDFDRLGNISVWSLEENDMQGHSHTVAYAYQMDIMRALIMDNEGLWDPKRGYQRAMADQFSNIHEFLAGALNHTDVVFSMTFDCAFQHRSSVLHRIFSHVNCSSGMVGYLVDYQHVQNEWCVVGCIPDLARLEPPGTCVTVVVA
ncbi:predicted protein [Lichtheimia corymbifera JMRC:FSU:9682]|uniref:Uncharacterized protein n=1 Tax=Lichtheimia corymbifera JMRC:FSU:9682 TaxID=1263082 RepID=A0A068RRN2_9FUNG|nr:predicted protein [Lichtheimia corymbifera JMRC:FSU:9682]